MKITQDEIISNWIGKDINKPLVSIECITYNHEKFIKQTLDGFLSQKTNFPFEIIIHDDASTDNTSDILKEYENLYPLIIKPIYELENQYSKPGVSISKIIYPYLKGDYVAICEGDDYWISENKLQMQIDFLQNNKDYTMSCHNAYKYNSFNGSKKLFNPSSKKVLTEKDIINRWSIPTASIVVRKSILSTLLPKKDEYVQGDIQIWLEAYSKGKIHYSSLPMSVYRYGVACSASVKSTDNPFKYLNANTLLWNDLNKYYNYRYNKYIKRKIAYNKRQYKKQILLKRSALLRVLKRIYRSFIVD